MARDYTQMEKSEIADIFPGLSDENDSCFEVHPTLWGYVLGSEYEERPSGGIVSVLRKAIGVFLIIAAVSLWIKPNTSGAFDVFTMKLSISLLFITLGGLFLYRSRQLVRREVQVNLTRRELRAGFRSPSGAFHLEGVHNFDDVDVVCLWDGDHDPEKAWLLLQLDQSDVALVAARGPAAALEPYRVRLAQDLGVPARAYELQAANTDLQHATPLLLGPRTYVSGLAA